MTAPPPLLHDLYIALEGCAYTAQVSAFGERKPGSLRHQENEADDFTATTPRGSVPVHNIIGKFNVTADQEQRIFILAGHYETLFKKRFTSGNDGAGTSTRVKAFFLLEMIGYKHLAVSRESQSTRWLQDFISQAAKQLGYSLYFFQVEEATTDDHVSILNVGIPSVDVVDAFYGRMWLSFDQMGVPS